MLGLIGRSKRGRDLGLFGILACPKDRPRARQPEADVPSVE